MLAWTADSKAMRGIQIRPSSMVVGYRTIVRCPLNTEGSQTTPPFASLAGVVIRRLPVWRDV